MCFFFCSWYSAEKDKYSNTILVVTVCGPLWLTASHKPEIYHIVLCSVLVDWQETIDQSTLYHTTMSTSHQRKTRWSFLTDNRTIDHDASRSSLQYRCHSLWTILQFCVIFVDIEGGSMTWLNFKPTQMNIVLGTLLSTTKNCKKISQT